MDLAVGRCNNTYSQYNNTFLLTRSLTVISLFDMFNIIQFLIYSLTISNYLSLRENAESLPAIHYTSTGFESPVYLYKTDLFRKGLSRISPEPVNTYPKGLRRLSGPGSVPKTTPKKTTSAKPPPPKSSSPSSSGASKGSSSRGSSANSNRSNGNRNSKSGSSSSRSGSESSSSVRSNSTHTQEGPPRNVRENIFDFEPLGENEMVRMTHDDWLSLDRSSDSFWLQPHNSKSGSSSWGSDHLLPSEDRIFYENIFDDAVNEIQSLQKRSDLGDFMVPETRRKIKSDDEYSEWSNFENEDEYSEWSNFEGEFMFQEPPRKIKSDDELLIGRNDVSRNKSGIEDIKYDESFLKDGEPFRRNDELLFDSPRSNESQKK